MLGLFVPFLLKVFCGVTIVFCSNETHVLYSKWLNRWFFFGNVDESKLKFKRVGSFQVIKMYIL